MNGNNNRNNNDERLRSSLSSSVKERAMEHEGNQLQAAKARTASMPSRMSSNGNTRPHNSLPSKNGIENGKSELPNKVRLPKKSDLEPKAIKGSNGPGDAKNNASSKGQSLKNKVASKGLQAMGVPKALSDGIVNSKMGKKAMGMAANPAAAALNGIKNAGKTEAEKDAVEKEEEEQEKEKRSGFISLRVPLKVKLIFFLAILPSFTFVILFLSVIVAYVADENGFNIFLGKLSSDEDIREISKMHDEFHGKGTYDGTWNSYSTADEFHSRSEEIGDIFEHFECKSAEECLNRDEVKFYIKVYDLSYRYKNKYHITLDWELLMSTALSMDLDVKDLFVKFLNDYNYDDVEKLDILMNLDWDYDYKKIPGYKYLGADDYRYDLQILAKNMVTKTTTQTCAKTVTNADGTTSVVITKTQTDIDVEEQYFKPGEKYYLKCDAGETYSISSNYRLDLAKFDDFLLEYIEHKMYLQDTGIDYETGETDMTPSEASGDYIFPLPSGATSCRSSVFGPRIHPIYGTYHNHSGDDYPAAAGTPVYAVADGVVSGAGFQSSMGNHVIINHGNGLTSIYMHASKLFVQTGDTVKQGDVIMAVGSTGDSTGPHLHITFKLNGTKVPPANYIGALKEC